MARLSRFAIAVIVSIFVIALLLMFGTAALRHWSHTSHDLPNVLLRCFSALPIVMGILALLWPSRKQSILLVVTVGFVTGLAYGYLAVRVFYRLSVGNWQILGGTWPQETLSFFNPLSWDVDLQAIVFGAVAGMCSLLLAIPSGRRLLRMALATAVVTVAVFAPVPILNAIAHNQELTVAMVMRRDAVPRNPVEWSVRYIRPIDIRSEATTVAQALKDAGVDGDYEVVWLFREGHGKRVLAIVVVPQPLTKTELPQPRGVNAIYLPQSGGWRTIPEQLPTVDRKITILLNSSADKGHPCQGYMYVDDILGTSYGMGIPKPNDSECLRPSNP
jgi:hypothetical protein